MSFADRSGIVGNNAIKPTGESISGALSELFAAYQGENSNNHVAFSVDIKPEEPTVIFPFLDSLVKKGTPEYRRHELEVYSFLSRVAGFAGDATAHLDFNKAQPPYFVTEATSHRLCLAIQGMRRSLSRDQQTGATPI